MLPRQDLSYWSKDTDRNFPKLSQDLEIDVAVIGGGIAGLTASYLLKQSGLKVAVFEKNLLGNKVTGRTTGKVTSQHGLTYSQLMKKLGREYTQLYASANQKAISQIEKITKDENIKCDWQRNDNYVFTEKADEVAKLKKETDISRSLGLPASFETTTSLPFKVRGAVKFTNQAKFHARKYVLGLANAVDGDGSYVFENTRIKRVRNGRPCRLFSGGHNIYARETIIATNVPFPFISHGVYCALEYPEKSYIVAGKYDKNLEGMYITAGKPTRSIMPMKAGSQQLLLIGGEGHVPGFTGIRAKLRYNRLADYAKHRFGINFLDYKWSTMDYISYDNVPLVGRLYPWTKHVFVITAFKKWGLTTSMVAAIITKDLILGEESNLAAFYRSNRFSPIKSMPAVYAKYLNPFS